MWTVRVYTGARPPVYRYRDLNGQSYTVEQRITMADLLFRTGHVVNAECHETQASTASTA